MWPIDVSELTVETLGKTVSAQHAAQHDKGFLLGRVVEIRHRFAADGSTRETRIKVEIFEGDPGVVVTLTLGPDMQLQKP
jgi:hypothetical protein